MLEKAHPQWVIDTRSKLDAFRNYCDSVSVDELLRCPSLTPELTNRFLIAQMMVDQLGHKLVNGGYAHA